VDVIAFCEQTEKIWGEKHDSIKSYRPQRKAYFLGTAGPNLGTIYIFLNFFFIFVIL